MPDKLKAIASRCKGAVHLSINPHRDEYVTAAQYLDYCDIATAGLEMADRDRIVATDTLIDIQFYPDTPVSFYRVLHHDLDAALTVALDLLDNPDG